MPGPLAPACGDPHADALVKTDAPQEPTGAGRAVVSPPERSLFESAPKVVLLSLFLGTTLSWPKAVAVWASNRFFDTDDAMHVVQARDWLAGQGWFDLTERRLDPPHGTVMHWTRVVDVPLAFLLRLFGLFTNPDIAERLTRLVYPAVLQVCLYAAIVWVARKLLGYRGVAAAVILAAMSMGVFLLFAPGRLNHHNVQDVLLVLMIGATIDSLDPGRARSGAFAAALAAASFAISLEDLPFVAIMVAIFGVAWIVRGPSFAKALAWFGGGLCLAMIVSFVATVPPWTYGEKICDAFSTAHLVAACMGGTAFLLLAAATPRLPHWTWRLGACALLGGVVLATIALAFHTCLGDPFSAVDPLVRSVWLANVTEAQPLGKMLRRETLATLPIAMPIFIGLGLACMAAWRETGESRARWLVVAAFTAMGVLGAFWEVIVASYVSAIAVFGAAWAFDRLFGRPKRRLSTHVVVPVLLFTAMIPQAWAAFALKPAQISRYGDPDACFESSAFKALDSLPPGLVLSPIDASPYILVFTRHSVVDGPYHRDNRGNRLAIEAFLGDAATARAAIRTSGARYVVVCPAAAEMTLYARKAPGGFAARLRDGAAPPWLRRINVPGTPYRVYEAD